MIIFLEGGGVQFMEKIINLIFEPFPNLALLFNTVNFTMPRNLIYVSILIF